MLTVSVEGLEELKRGLDDLGRSQVPFATALALTRTAGRARAAAVAEMATKLHAPTRFTLNSLRVDPATKSKLSAMVYLKDGKGGRRYTDPRFPGLVNEFVAEGVNAEKIIGHLFSGGSREWKGIEKLFKARGLLPAGMAMVPGAGAPLDAYGKNISRGFYVKMLAYFGALRDPKQNSTDESRGRQRRTAARKAGVNDIDYFISRGPGQWFGGGSWKNGRRQNLPPGIWQRVRHGSHGHSFVRPIIMFVRQPTGYKRYFDLQDIMQQAKNLHFQAEFDAALKTSIATAFTKGSR